MMELATDVTASDHSGRYRKKGSRPPHVEDAVRLLPEPTREEVAKVRRHFAARLDRLSELKRRPPPPSGLY